METRIVLHLLISVVRIHVLPELERHSVNGIASIRAVGQR